MKLRKEESGNCSFWSDKQRTEHKKHFKNHRQLRVSKQEREKERQRVKWRDGEQQQKIKISFDFLLENETKRQRAPSSSPQQL